MNFSQIIDFIQHLQWLNVIVCIEFHQFSFVKLWFNEINQKKKETACKKHKI